MSCHPSGRCQEVWQRAFPPSTRRKRNFNRVEEEKWLSLLAYSTPRSGLWPPSEHYCSALSNALGSVLISVGNQPLSVPPLSTLAFNYSAHLLKVMSRDSDRIGHAYYWILNHQYYFHKFCFRCRNTVAVPSTARDTLSTGEPRLRVSIPGIPPHPLTAIPTSSMKWLNSVQNSKGCF